MNRRQQPTSVEKPRTDLTPHPRLPSRVLLLISLLGLLAWITFLVVLASQANT